MTSKLNISLTPMRLETGADEERATFGQLQIKALNQLLTEGTDVSGGEAAYRTGPYISGYHLAEWLAWNWWRLRWEPRTAGQGPGRRDWGFAHCMATIGEGYVWPNITVSTDGFWTSLVSDRSAEPAVSLFRYSGACFVGVAAMDLESAIDEFVPQVVHLANNAGLVDTNLHRLWQDLQLERGDAQMARFRKFEALLGCDPDELDAKEIEARLDDASVLGENALQEVAIGSVSGGADLGRMLSAQQISEITQQAGFPIRPEDGVKINAPELGQWGNGAAWRTGVSVATAIRRQERLGDGPISNEVLAKLAGTTDSTIGSSKPGGEFSWVFLREYAPGQVALRSKWETGRRFELARLIGDRIFVDGMPDYQEPLSPATRSYSYRQKAQRAFAAELLSPWPTVKEMLGNDYSEENQEQVAEHFSVSQWTINTLVMNNVDDSYEDRMLLQ